jgi:hypothetical protein
VELKLFAATRTRLESFRALDFSFATVFDLWTEIVKHPDIERFFQFQIHDGELNRDVLSRLPGLISSKFDRATNNLPWVYLRDNRLIPTPGRFQLTLSQSGKDNYGQVCAENRIQQDMWAKPTVNFLWRYRDSGGAIRGFGQKPQSELVRSYSGLFQRLISEFDCHILVCGMNIVTIDSNREITDSKYPDFGLDLPPGTVTYMKGLSWPIELEIAARADVCCGHASGFSEGLWLKRGEKMVLMDAPPHYLLKTLYHRMPLFDLNAPMNLARAFLDRSSGSYFRRISRLLRAHA